MDGKVKADTEYTVYLTVALKKGMDDKVIKKPSKNTVKVNGKAALMTTVFSGGKSALIVYTFKSYTDGELIIDDTGDDLIIDDTAVAQPAVQTPAISEGNVPDLTKMYSVKEANNR